jgi:hypothetical protein
MADSYPILKYPREIKQKLENQQSVLVEVEEIVNDNFSERADRDIPPLPTPYHKHTLYVLYGIYVLVLGSLVFKLLTTGILAVIAGLSTIIGTVSYLPLKYRYHKLIKNYKNQRRSTVKIKKRVLEKLVSIDWSDNVLNIVRSDKRSIEGDTKRGVSEYFFLTYLLRIDLGETSFGYEYPIDGYPKPYTSDIEIILSNGLGIQIEIDEPYVGTTHKPHHCRDIDDDYNRDLYFTNNGWIVIRFSERQIVTNPDGCCGFIAQVVINLAGDISLLNLAKAAKNLRPDPHWSKAEAKVMAKDDERQKYLIPAGLWHKSVDKKIILKKRRSINHRA